MPYQPLSTVGMALIPMVFNTFKSVGFVGFVFIAFYYKGLESKIEEKLFELEREE